MKGRNHKPVPGEPIKEEYSEGLSIGKHILFSGLGGLLIGIAVSSSNIVLACIGFILIMIRDFIYYGK